MERQLVVKLLFVLTDKFRARDYIAFCSDKSRKKEKCANVSALVARMMTECVAGLLLSAYTRRLLLLPGTKR
jgi:hypothetical protein